MIEPDEGLYRINLDTGNKGGMICCEYADSVSMSHLQQQLQQQQAFSATIRCLQHPVTHPHRCYPLIVFIGLPLVTNHAEIITPQKEIIFKIFFVMSVSRLAAT